MLRDRFEHIVLTTDFESLPLRSSQRAPGRSNVLALLGMTTLAAIVVVPQIALAGYAILTPNIRQSLVDQPVAAAQLGVAMAFWIVLFAWPLKTLIARINGRRDIEITHETVSVADHSVFGGKHWQAPLAAFRGVAHHIRSSLSGTRHELVLVHPEPERSIVLVAADRITDTEAARMIRLIGLPQVAPAEIYWSQTRKQKRFGALSYGASAA